MKTHFDIEQLIGRGTIASELEYERAMVADRKLRLLAKESGYFKNLRSQLRDLIESYEQQHWANHKTITSEQLHEGELAEQVAEDERLFIEKRRLLIRKKLKDLELSQEELGRILGHKSKTHMSELMNGIKPFTLPDLVAINLLLKINLNDLIPVFLSDEKKQQIKAALLKLNKPTLAKTELSF
ncbi:MAG: transcriptional regulator [Bacteroidetes bacterium]|nr:transcriptional regulator [Bacteroidota bacterium]